MARYVALLRGINVSGKNRIPMAKLREACSKSGFEGVGTYIQSGNLVLDSPLSARAVEESLEAVIAEAFGLSIPVIARKDAIWKRYLIENPFPDEARREANRVLLCLSKRKPRAAAVQQLQQYATQGERIAQGSDAVWIHYAGGIARSKLTPAVLDRHVGSPVTARNWRTVQKLEDLVLRTDDSNRSQQQSPDEAEA